MAKAMTKRKTLLEELHEEIAANPAMNETYQRELARLEISNQILRARQHAKLSQADLADRIGTKQAGVARMERADYTGFTVSTLAKIAVATGLQLEVRLRPKLTAKR
jgi:ribosome-binding protein aMBF1 (putative translation factor)